MKKNDNKTKEKLIISISAKATLLIIGLALILAEIAMTYFALVTARNNNENSLREANSYSSLASKAIDADKFSEIKTQIQSIYENSPTKPLSDEWGSDEWNAYIAQFSNISETQTFIDLKKTLSSLAETSSDIDCFYLSFIDYDRKLFIYVVDSSPEEDACPPGCIDPLYECNFPLIEDHALQLPAYITNTEEYGWLVSSISPIVDENNEVIGYACVDIEMEMVRNKQRQSIVNYFIFLILTIILIVIGGLIAVYFLFTKPIRKLTDNAKSYDLNNIENNHDKFQSLQINTRDEVEDLNRTLKKMENDVFNKISELTVMNDELLSTQIKAEQMEELANKDGLTGLLNKIAYSRFAMELGNRIERQEDIKFAIVMIDLNNFKEINDDYGHDIGDKVLSALADLLKKIFGEQNAYRIGGDEFAAILLDENYENIDNLINDFRSKVNDVRNNIKELKCEVAAAIGFAKYDKEIDTYVDDVFKRADKAMYENKHQMKETNR